MNPLGETSNLAHLAADWFRFLGGVTLKGSALLLLVGAVVTALPRLSAATRHFAWTVGIAGLLLLPVLGPTLPVWHLQGLPDLFPTGQPVPPPEPLSHPQATEGLPAFAPDSDLVTGPTPPTTRDERAAPVTGKSSRLTLILFGIWLVGLLAILVAYVQGYARIRQTLTEAEPLTQPEWDQSAKLAAEGLGVPRDRLRLFRSPRAMTPLTFGWCRPAILLPPDSKMWQPKQRHEVLVHEIAHVKRGDCLTQGLANLACALFWFNPVVWFAARRMLVERERACDDQVLLRGGKASDYAHNLLEIARSVGADLRTAQVSVAMARRSQIAGRLLAVLDPRLPRKAPGPGVLVAVLVSLMALLFPLAAVQPGPVVVHAHPGLHPAEAEQGFGFNAADKESRPTAISLLEVREAIAEVNQQFQEAVRRGDASLIGQYYSPEALVVASNKPYLSGRREITEHLQGIFNIGFFRLEIVQTELSPLGDMFYEIGKFTYEHQTGVLTISGRYFTIWRREGDQWLIYREITNI